MRVEANISIRPRGSTEFGTRVEVKNMNSFRSVERAIAFEIDRQVTALDGGESLVLETRGWSDDRGATYHMRSKETSDDYRYFPEPDLPPLRVDRPWLDRLRSAMPELPAARRERFRTASGLTAYDAGVLVADPDAAALFEATVAADTSASTKSVANWVSGEYLRLRNAATSDAPVRVEPVELAALVKLVDDGAISRANAKEVLAAHATAGTPVASVIARAWLPPDLRYRDRGSGRRRGPRRQPERRRRLQGRQGPGHRLPGRAGDEGHEGTGRGVGRADPGPRAARRMNLTNVVFWALGAALMAIGYARARGPWSRYRALREQQANIDRYEAWRGGLRTEDDGPTGASVAMDQARRAASVGGVIIAVGVALFALGFLFR